MRIGLAAVTVALAATLAGCGGGDAETAPTPTTTRAEGSTVEDQAAIRETLERLAEKADPEACSDAMTVRWVDASYPPSGSGALQECRSAQKPGTKVLAEGVRFGDIEIDGNEATATFSELGPDVGGTRGRVRLLQDGDGVWRVDELLELRITDRERFLAATRAGLSHGPGAIRGRPADCMIAALGRIPTPVLERRAQAHSFPVSILADCLGDGDPREAALAIVRYALDASPRFNEHADCALRRLDGALSTADARAYLAQEDRVTMQGLVGRALAACGAVPPLGGGERSVT
jgi:hypothetical protein